MIYQQFDKKSGVKYWLIFVISGTRYRYSDRVVSDTLQIPITAHWYSYPNKVINTPIPIPTNGINCLRLKKTTFCWSEIHQVLCLTAEKSKWHPKWGIAKKIALHASIKLRSVLKFFKAHHIRFRWKISWGSLKSWLDVYFKTYLFFRKF